VSAEHWKPIRFSCLGRDMPLEARANAMMAILFTECDWMMRCKAKK
jgi:hypothetical protein